MYLVQNAFRSVWRNKARNLLIGMIVLVIATASCIALSIREAAETTKEERLNQLKITAQISYDRTSVMANMQSSGQEGKGNYNFSKLSGSSMTMDEYLTYTEALKEGDSYYYSVKATLNAAGDLLAYGAAEETEETVAESTDAYSDRGGKKDYMLQGDFSLNGYSSYDAMLSLFGEDGSCSMTEGTMFDENSNKLECIISDELAMYNALKKGDTIQLSNPNNEDEIYEFTVVGIYTNAASDEGNQTFASTDPANNIYLNYNALMNVLDTSAAEAVVTTAEDGTESSTALSSQLSFTYTFMTAEHYHDFTENIYEYGLGEDYLVSSSDLSAYESSLSPLNTLSTMSGWFFVIVLSIGGVILVVLNIFNLRERKYEVGVLTAIGMKKHKVATQFVVELFSVAFLAIVIGTTIGAGTAVPVTNALLAGQVESAQESAESLNQNFGMNRFSKDNAEVTYVESISSATNLTVVMELAGVGIVLTILSSLAALISIMRYEPLKILSSRS